MQSASLGQFRNPKATESMGGHSPVITVNWAGLVPGSVTYITEAPAYQIPNVVAGHPHAWFCDAPGWLMSRTSPTLQGRAYTFGDWLNHARAKIEFYFKDPAVNTVVVFFDCRSDPAKSIIRRRQTSRAQVPVTPAAGWESYLIEFTKQYHDHAASLMNREPFPLMEILLPGDDGSGSRDKFEFTDYMLNADFKYGFFIPLVCKHLLKDFLLGPNKMVILRGKDTAIGFKNDAVCELPPELCVPYTEADCIMGLYALLFKGHTILVDAPDFDVVSNLLLTADLRLLKRAFENRIDLNPAPSSSNPFHTKLDVFTNQVYVVRGQWLSRFGRKPATPKAGVGGEGEAESEEVVGKNTVVDINLLYLGFHALANDIRKEYGVHIRNPVADQVLIAMLCGKNDYIDSSMLPKVGPAALFGAYFIYCRFFPQGLVLNHMRGGKYVGYTIDLEAFGTFIAAAYCRAFRRLHPEMDFGNIPACYHKIADQLTTAKQEFKVTIPVVRQLAANASWTLRWYSDCCHGLTPTESTRRIGDRSQFGWEWAPTVSGDRREVVATSDVSVDWMLALSHPKQPSIVPAPAGRAKLSAPRPPSYTQFDTVSH